MQGSYGPAIAHIRSGSKILTEMQYDDVNQRYSHDVLEVPKSPYVPTSAMEDLFLRLDFSVSQVYTPLPRITLTHKSSDGRWSPMGPL